MSKAYLLVICLLVTTLTGCIESDDNLMGLEESVNDYVNALSGLLGEIGVNDAKKFCTYEGYKFDDETNKITLASNTELKTCIERLESNAADRSREYKLTASNYTEENMDYRASSNSGFVYSVNVVLEACERVDEFEPWECEQFEEVSYFFNDYYDFLWVEVDGQWLRWKPGAIWNEEVTDEEVTDTYHEDDTAEDEPIEEETEEEETKEEETEEEETEEEDE